jgi:hypothetical protein
MGVRRLPLLLVLVAACAAGTGVWAQPVPGGPGLGAVRDTFRVAEGPSFPLRPNVVPGSEVLWLLRSGLVPSRLAPDQYRLDHLSGTLTLDAVPADSGAVLVVHYRTLPALPVYARRVVTDEADSLGRQPVEEQAPAAVAPLFGAARLERRGSISRGITAGSNRDVAVESGLRMELSGPITDDVTVQAVLTDASTPIQPEGTTQQLSDFDRVYVQIDAPVGTARLGDVDLAYTGAEFASLTRKIQGVAVEGAVPAFGAFAGGRVRAAGAATRGIFRTQDVAPIEGVQGPYRLRGELGEEFVVVIAGSERVYLDGALLTRGEAEDYVIDYATGELTFTPRHLITAERRITVDFEYTTSRFTRTLLAADADAAFWPRAGADPRGRLAVTVLREADAASFGDELGLTEADLDAIAAAGDAPVLVPGAERVPFDPESPFVLYTPRDTLFAGETYSIFVPATAEADSVYRVRFSRVADGTGQYRRGAEALNGILYEWVGPTGGDYVPFRLLPAPESRRLVDVRGTLEPLPAVEVFGEWAGSANDLNTLSALGADDDAGMAGLAGLRLRPTALFGGRLAGEVRHRQQGARFRGFDRTRPVEFNRLWNLARAGSAFDSLDALGEATTEGFLRWAASEATALQAEAGRLALGDGFEALRGALALGLDGTPLALPALDYRLDAAASDDGFLDEEGLFLRQHGSLRYPLLQGRLTPILGFEGEHRQQEIVGADSLAFGSFAFLAVRPGLLWAAGALTASGSVEYRREEDLLDGRLAPSADATTVETTLGYRPASTLTTEARVAYRYKQFEGPFQALGRENSESLAIRWTGRATPLRRAVEVSTRYEALTERTPLLQETYFLVGAELGEFVWRDGEGEPRPGEPDGVAQVDEFFPETTPLEGTYARTFVPSDELFPTIGVEAQLRLRLDPGRFVAREDARALARLLRLVQAQTTLDVREQSTDPNLRQVLFLNPSYLQQRDPRVTAEGDTLEPATLSGRFRVGQDFTFFPQSTRYGLRLALAHLTSTSRLAAGLETRLLRTARLDADAALGGPFRARLVGTAERNRTVSAVFASRTFDITSLGAEPQAVWTPTTLAAVTVGLAFSTKTNGLAGPGEARGARLLRLPVEARWAFADRLSLQARAERADVTVEGGGAGLTLFELTEGRGPGTSYLWSLTGQYVLSELLRASFVYDGRAPANAPVIHTVRVQLSAVF